MAFCGGLSKQQPSDSLLMMNMVDDPTGFRFLFLANCLSHSLFINFGGNFTWAGKGTQPKTRRKITERGCSICRLTIPLFVSFPLTADDGSKRATNRD